MLLGKGGIKLRSLHDYLHVIQSYNHSPDLIAAKLQKTLLLGREKNVQSNIKESKLIQNKNPNAHVKFPRDNGKNIYVLQGNENTKESIKNPKSCMHRQYHTLGANAQTCTKMSITKKTTFRSTDLQCRSKLKK